MAVASVCVWNLFIFLVFLFLLFFTGSEPNTAMKRNTTKQNVNYINKHQRVLFTRKKFHLVRKSGRKLQEFWGQWENSKPKRWSKKTSHLAYLRQLNGILYKKAAKPFNRQSLYASSTVDSWHQILYCGSLSFFVVWPKMCAENPIGCTIYNNNNKHLQRSRFKKIALQIRCRRRRNFNVLLLFCCFFLFIPFSDCKFVGSINISISISLDHYYHHWAKQRQAVIFSIDIDYLNLISKLLILFLIFSE